MFVASWLLRLPLKTHHEKKNFYKLFKIKWYEAEIKL